MTVETLINVLSQLEPSAETFVEYSPRRHEYVKEPVAGVRAEDKDIVLILGASDLF